MENILEIHNLTKRFGSVLAVNKLQLNIPKGSVYGLLGPNGSGKTTTLAMITGILKPTSGSYSWFEGETKIFQQRIGAILETPNFYHDLNALENLKIIQMIKRDFSDDLNELLRKVQLFERRKSTFKTYSLGMKQRLAIAAALIGRPEVVIFDEPTNGLDPQGIADIRNLIVEIAQTGITVLMASHILAEVERICSHVAILKEGQLLSNGPVSSLFSDRKIIYVASDNPEGLMKELSAMSAIDKIEKQMDRLVIHGSKELSVPDLNRQLVMNGHRIHLIYEKAFDLETHFMKTIG